MRQTKRRWWAIPVQRHLLLLAITVAALLVLSTRCLGANLESSASPAWAQPTAMALKRVGDLDSTTHEPNFFSNLDCDQLTYRLAATSINQTGCFTRTAFGLLDSDTDMVLFNGSDEAMPLLGYTSQQVLVPWPEALNVIALQPLSTGGSYLSLYGDMLSDLGEHRNILGQLTAKQLTGPPDMPVKDSEGQQLVVNPQTLTFSAGGSWLVAEDLNGSFVRVNLATLEITAFAPSDTISGNPSLLKSQLSISRDGRFVAINNDAAGTFKVYDLASCQIDGTFGWQPEQCDSYDYKPFVGGQLGQLQAIRHVRFLNDGLLSFEAQTETSNGDGLYELAPTASITSLIDYLGLGDSYTSGEGAYDYEDGTDTADDSCHLSVNSYPVLLTRDLFTDQGGHTVACSGALINDVGSTSDTYRGQVKGVANWQQLNQSQPAWLSNIITSYLPGYIAQQRFVSNYQPNIITVSVGGDDIGFGDMLERCVEPHLSLHLSDETCFSTYEDRLEVKNLIDRTKPRWTALYKQLLAEAPGSRLYVIGYPQIMVDDGSCGLNVHLSKNEQEFALELTDYLNSAIQQSVSNTSATYVDVSQALSGHRLCETSSYDVAVNGLTAGTDGGPLDIKIFGKESYHPNALGKALIEQAILKQTHNLTQGGAANANTPPSDGTALLNAPKSGRVVNNLIPDDNMAPALAMVGGKAVIALNGSRDGLKARSVYALRLDGASGEIISSGVSDNDGDLSLTVTVPAETLSGGHTLDVTGINQADEPIDVTQPIYISSSYAYDGQTGSQTIQTTVIPSLFSSDANTVTGRIKTAGGPVAIAASSKVSRGVVSARHHHLGRRLAAVDRQEWGLLGLSVCLLFIFLVMLIYHWRLARQGHGSNI